MAVKIRLKRMGKIRAPFYRVVVMDGRAKRDGRAIEEIGLYHPTREPSLIEIDSERAGYWLGVGAQPTEQVLALLKVTGDWQKHKGLPGAEGTLKVAEPRPDKKARYEAAMAAAGAADDERATSGAPTARKKTVRVETPAGADQDDSGAEPAAQADTEAGAAPATEVPVEDEPSSKALEAAQGSAAADQGDTGAEPAVAVGEPAAVAETATPRADGGAQDEG